GGGEEAAQHGQKLGGSRTKCVQLRRQGLMTSRRRRAGGLAASPRLEGARASMTTLPSSINDYSPL
ncbi:unnamed protein product, partial [Discosporangium mesarthrocarpum]